VLGQALGDPRKEDGMYIGLGTLLIIILLIVLIA
jgi:hypothetical protein